MPSQKNCLKVTLILPAKDRESAALKRNRAFAV